MREIPHMRGGLVWSGFAGYGTGGNYTVVDHGGRGCVLRVVFR